MQECSMSFEDSVQLGEHRLWVPHLLRTYLRGYPSAEMTDTFLDCHSGPIDSTGMVLWV